MKRLLALLFFPAICFGQITITPPVQTASSLPGGPYLPLHATADSALRIDGAGGATVTDQGGTINLTPFGANGVQINKAGATLAIDNISGYTYGSSPRINGVSFAGTGTPTLNVGAGGTLAASAFTDTTIGSNVTVATNGQYLLPCFTDPSNQTLQFLTSRDLNRFAKTGGAAFTPSSGNLRDPDIVYLPSLGLYDLVYTAGSFGVVNYFGHAQSPDLINWTQLSNISTSSTSALLTWSPTHFQDPADSSWHIIVGCDATTSSLSPLAMQPYEIHPTNAGWTTFSTPVAITGAGLTTSMIPTRLIKKGSTYYLWFQNYTGGATGNTQTWILSSSSPFSGYATYKSGNWAGWGAALPAGSGGFEVGAIVENPTGTWTALGYADPLGTQKTISTDDWATWSTRTLIQYPFNLQNASACTFITKNLTNIQDILGYDDSNASYGQFPTGILVGSATPPTRQAAPSGSTDIFSWFGNGSNSAIFGGVTSGFKGLYLCSNLAENSSGSFILADTTKSGWFTSQTYDTSSDNFFIGRAASGTSGAVSFATMFNISSTGNTTIGVGNLIFGSNTGVNGQVPRSSGTTQTWVNAPTVLATVTGIDAKATGTTALYTVPAGKTLHVVGVQVTCTAATAITIGPTLGIGIAANEDDIYSSTVLTGLVNTTTEFNFGTTQLQRNGVATSVVKVGIDTAATGTSQTLAISLIGWLN